jgi:DcuC family C4-dicarboxylate transporter
MALSPVVPLVLLFLCSPPFGVFSIPPEWLATTKEIQASANVTEYRTIGLAMLIGLLVVVIVTAIFGERKTLSRVGYEFFSGAGYAYTEVISLIVVAKCFATSANAVGFGALLEFIATHVGEFFSVAAVLGTAAFAWLSGSGIAATTGLFPLFAESSQQHRIDPFSLGSVVVLASAAGRTASPMAAASLMSANLTGTDSWQLSRRVFLPLCAGLLAAFLVQSLWMNK